ncbi:MAG: hypothetical protein IT258_22355 [Saprospiraceae bacterium]|nr:hypothetical protein [Saprospiraceae bacterium]
MDSVLYPPNHIAGDVMNISSSLLSAQDCSSFSSNITCSPNNLFSADPLFLDTAAHDFRLHPCSPARNAGSNAAAQAAGLSTDIAGLPRIQEGTVDMGAHETPAFSINSATVTEQPCTTKALGTVELALEWGCPPFYLSWSEAAGASGTGFSDTASAVLQLPPGAYSVTVVDGRTEAATIAFTIVQATQPSLGIEATDLSCAVGSGPSTGGTATAVPLGGAGPYAFAWSNAQTGATVTGLQAGPIAVTITDANGCTAYATTLIGQQGSLQVGTTIQNPFYCPGEEVGIVEVQPIGGTPPFAYQWEGLPWEQSPALDSIGPGSYSATVTDALGCTGDVQFSFGEPTPVAVSVAMVQPACHGETGTASATTTGGMPGTNGTGYTYLWDNGATSPTVQLPLGPHTVTATDVHGCTGTASVLVVEPPLLTASVAAQPQTLCFGEANGQLAALPQGGTPPYAYDWGLGQPIDSTLTSLGPGPYFLNLTDANGCSATASVGIAEHPEITLLDSIQNASGPTAADGGVAITGVSGGTGGGYVFAWSNGATTQGLANVATGDYSLTVTDSQGCTAFFSFFVDFNSAANSPQANPFGAAIVPNPSGRDSGARLQLANAHNQLVFSVFDTKGRLVEEGEFVGVSAELPRGLAAGSYRVVLANGEQRAVLNWVVE